MGLFRNALLVVVMALLLAKFLPQLRPSSQQPLYRILGVSETASATEIKAAYDRRHALWSVDKEPTHKANEKFIDIQHAYDILSDERMRRNYDIFHLDELEGSALHAKKQHTGINASSLQFPLWQIRPAIDLGQSGSTLLTNENFGKLVLESDDIWVIQLYSEMSLENNELLHSWGEVARHLEGVAKVGHVEIGMLPLSVLLAEKTLFSNQPVFRTVLPDVVIFTSTCRRFNCLLRYRGLKTVDTFVDWLSTSVLKLPRILYYNFKSLMKDIIQGTGPHKVKVIGFSSTGERAAPYIRQAAKKYWEYAVFAMVLWQEQNATFWESGIGVKSAPAIVFVKDPGLKPVIYHGSLNSSTFGGLMEDHKAFELPQLRSISAADLGCDARGYSMAGNNTATWYCVIVAGRTGLPLSQMRGVMREVLHNLTDTTLRDDVPQRFLAAEALQSRRLSLSWLDGEVQKDFCYFYLHSPTMFEACGPRRYGEVDELPKIFLVRYQRKPRTSEEEDRLEKHKAVRANNLWMSLIEDNHNVASQIVSKYNGSAEIADIVQWISNMVYEGDNNKLPSFSGRMPALVPEERLPFGAQTQEIVTNVQAKVADKGQWMFQAFLLNKVNKTLIPVIAFLAIILALHLLSRRKYSRHITDSVPAVAAGPLRDATSPGDVR